ncbi:hypothetical protein B0H17DRAFT_1177251 [Mycena rosella]|uniref:Uncharacterized protein n=1 Tax=Mycena rosella TaxID=1033263 RepID=A0AAD7DU81_MYCRO|nr:hypothetical protein B0H17DRAFT_1177251 [Mycena rosella]
MNHLGWKMIVDEQVDPTTPAQLWDEEPPKVKEMPKKTTISRPDWKGTISDHVFGVHKLCMRPRNRDTRSIPIASYYQLELKKLGLSDDRGPERCETHLLKICQHYVAIQSATALHRRAQTNNGGFLGIPSSPRGANWEATAGKTVSERTVERAVGSALSGIFYGVNKVKVLRQVHPFEI